MVGMPEHIGKGPILRVLDGRYANVSKHTQRRQRLNGGGDVATIGETVDADGLQVLKPGDARHLRRHWFTSTSADPDAYWWEPYVQHILKQGLIKAFDTAMIDPNTGQPQNPHLPIETLWICSGPRDTAPFEVFVTWNTRQVTLIIHSPDLPAYVQPGGQTVKEDMWVVKRVWPNAQHAIDQPLLDDDILIPANVLGSPDQSQIVARRPKTPK